MNEAKKKILSLSNAFELLGCRAKKENEKSIQQKFVSVKAVIGKEENQNEAYKGRMMEVRGSLNCERIRVPYNKLLTSGLFHDSYH